MREPVPELEPVELPAGEDQVEVLLWRLPNPGQPPVLLLHGASAQHETFLIPRGRSLGEYLWRSGYEPWLLDWRGSCLVTSNGGRALLDGKRNVLDFDEAARLDVPRAVRRIRQLRDDGDGAPSVHVVAHCMGAGVLAQAIAAGHLTQKDGVGRVVLLTLGLFYEPPLDGRLKSQDFVLERLWLEPGWTAIDPRVPGDEWPEELQTIYRHWAPRLRPHPVAEHPSAHELCDRVSLMYGTPYREPNLVPEIHGVRRLRFAQGATEPGLGERLRGPVSGASGVLSRLDREAGSWRRREAHGTLELSGAVGEFEDGEALWADDDRVVALCRGEIGDIPAELPVQFGAIPLRMYLQGARNVRRRWAAPFADHEGKDEDWIGPDAWHRFRELGGITLITGARNQLWHRDSIDRMAEWLLRGPRQPRCEIRREVLADYAHQDLLWGRHAEGEVYPIVLEGLRGAVQPRTPGLVPRRRAPGRPSRRGPEPPS